MVSKSVRIDSKYGQRDNIDAVKVTGKDPFEIVPATPYLEKHGSLVMRFPKAGGLSGGLCVTRLFIVCAEGILFNRKLKLWLFNNRPEAPSGDHELFELDDTDDDKLAGFIEAVAQDWSSVSGKAVASVGASLDIKLPVDYGDLYAQLEFMGGSDAFANANAVRISIAVSQD